jgi:hypothetical protein
MTERSYYVETSVWGMIPQGQPRELRRASLQFFRRLPRPAFFISSVVLDEIGACEQTDRSQILEIIEATAPTLLEVTLESYELARFYIESGILPAGKRADALHVALSTVHQMDVLVSWNHRHMANVRKTEQYRGANLLRSYRQTPLILTPLEVLHE